MGILGFGERAILNKNTMYETFKGLIKNIYTNKNKINRNRTHDGPRILEVAQGKPLVPGIWQHQSQVTPGTRGGTLPAEASGSDAVSRDGRLRKPRRPGTGLGPAAVPEAAGAPAPWSGPRGCGRARAAPGRCGSGLAPAVSGTSVCTSTG